MTEQSTLSEEPSPELQPWPDRLKASASLLKLTSSALQTAMLDEHRFRLLTNPTDTGEQAVIELREFNRLLVTALTALIDLTGYDNPDREYPNLAQWFDFTCPNVNYGRHTEAYYVIKKSDSDR